jgi:hypothetical protein
LLDNLFLECARQRLLPWNVMIHMIEIWKCLAMTIHSQGVQTVPDPFHLDLLQFSQRSEMFTLIFYQILE